VSIEIVPLYAFQLVLILLPGLAVTAAVANRRTLHFVYAVILSVTVSASLGYAAFWIYLGSKLLGRIFSFAVIAISAGALARALKNPQIRILMKNVAAPFGYVLTVGVCYSCLFFLFSKPSTSRVDLANVRFFEDVRPGDNLIPFIFAERIYDRQPVRPFCCGDWLSSDRPPLQAGIFLLQRPVRIFGNTGLQYQLSATALQCLWLCGVWALLKAVRAPPHRMRQVLGFLVFSGFLFYNSVYTWPKLLSATFMLFAFSIVIPVATEGRGITTFETALASASISLAILAHPGSVFSLPALLLVLVRKRSWLTLQRCVLGGVIIAAFVLPWIAYQKFYDPPGNRLLKMHLAGVSGIDSRSVAQSIWDAYRTRSLAGILQYKWTNISTLLGPEPAAGFGLGGNSRLAQREYIWNSIGVVNVGWLVALALFLGRKNLRAMPYAGRIILAALVDFLVWSLLIFGPRGTITTHGSGADILLLSIGLLGFVLTLPSLVILLLLALQLFNFFAVWVFFRPAAVPTVISGATAPLLQIPLLVAGLACTTVLLWHFAGTHNSKMEAAPDV
jgi:hypothetical protein